ncbi:MAG TPA: hypothetical protein VK961_16830 [Chthoniobacter sp.]|nr:hypothetical protein [Chthoniobacter sp.]
MKSPRWLLVTVLLGSGLVSTRAQKSVAPFFPPNLPPIADANPAVREERDVLVQTGFTAARVRDKMILCMEAGPLESLKLKVGAKMVLGMSTKTYIYPEGKPRPENPYVESLGGLLEKPHPLNMSFINPKLTPGYFAAPDGPLQPGKPCVVEMTCEIFETDIPPQHMWSPRSGKYKVLWQTTLRQTIEEKDRLPEFIQKSLDRAPKPQPTPPPLHSN